MAKPQDESRPIGPAVKRGAGDRQSSGSGASPSEGRLFEIRVKGHLGANWSDWLEGLELTPLANGEMVLCGTIVDQAALMGILNKLNRLNLTILSLNAVNPKE